MEQQSLERQLISRRLETMKVGEVITFEQLSELVSADVKTKRRHCLVSAMKTLQERSGIVFKSVHNIGYERIDDSKIIETATDSISKVRRCAERGSAVLACADYENLTESDKKVYSTNAAMLGFMEQFSTSKTMKQLSKCQAVNFSVSTFQTTLNASLEAMAASGKNMISRQGKKVSLIV